MTDVESKVRLFLNHDLNLLYTQVTMGGMLFRLSIAGPTNSQFEQEKKT